MDWMPAAVFIVVAFAARPIALRRWREGRLSDRSAAVLLVARFPLLAFGFGLLIRGPLPLVVGLTGLTTAVAVLTYPRVLAAIREGASLRREGANPSGESRR
jgi:hypothetical protein